LIHRAYAPGEIDAIAAYCADINRNYLLPVELSVDRAVIQLRLEPSLNNQRIGVNWARDFEFEARLKQLLGPIAQLGERRHGMAKAAGSSPAGSTQKIVPKRETSLGSHTFAPASLSFSRFFEGEVA
jgi:hypothetical protein